MVKKECTYFHLAHQGPKLARLELPVMEASTKKNMVKKKESLGQDHNS